MAKQKTLADWEMELYYFAPDGVPKGKDKYTADEFVAYARENGYIHVNKEVRHEWLETNGYELTRDNMIDLTLVGKK